MIRRPVRLIVMLLLLVAAGAGCGGDDGETSAGTTLAVTTSAPVPTTAPPSTQPSGPTAEARVYFARDGKVATAGRRVATPAVARGAVEALLEGPDADEQALGMTSALGAGVSLLDLDVVDGEATVALSGLLAPDADVALEVAQVVFTLTQFPTVDTVTIRPEGAEAEVLGFDSVPVAGVDRGDFEEQTPLILVEAPTPGAEVGAPVTVSGIANTFEANVRYEVLGADGAVVDDGFTTASAGTGTWGDFSFRTDGPSGAATIRVFQESAEDGSRTDVYEVPVTVR